MKSILKIFGVIFGLILIICVAAVVYVTTLDPNDYKGFIADKFQENLKVIRNGKANFSTSR